MILLIQRFDGFMEFFKGGGRGIEVRSSYFVEYWIIVKISDFNRELQSNYTLG